MHQNMHPENLSLILFLFRNLRYRRNIFIFFPPAPRMRQRSPQRRSVNPHRVSSESARLHLFQRSYHLPVRHPRFRAEWRAFHAFSTTDHPSERSLLLMPSQRYKIQVPAVQQFPAPASNCRLAARSMGPGRHFPAHADGAAVQRVAAA